MEYTNDKKFQPASASDSQASKTQPGMDQDYERFKKKIYQLTGLCLDKYKERQMKRRLNSLMNLYGKESFAEYYNLLVTDAAVRQKFLDRTTINVSEFFRNPEKFTELQEKILPELYKRFHSLKIWSAGCSIGTEPYSLAIILEEMQLGNYSILATDVDTKILRQAALGVYIPDQVKNVDPSLMKKYFEPLEEEKFQIKEDLRRRIKLKKQNILEDSFERNFALILCRNVVIYFTDEAKNKLYRNFADSLMPGGVLFIGNTERVFNAEEMGLESFSTFFYRKKT